MRICPTSAVTLLSGDSIPALPNLHLSARDLISLRLLSVPYTRYISLEAMATCLSAFTNLGFFTLEFQSPSSCPDWGGQRPLLLTRVDLLALIKLELGGVSKYSEDLLARISAPVISATVVTFFNGVIFDIPQLFKFFSRRRLKSVKRAELFWISTCLCTYDTFDWKALLLVRICSQLLLLLSSGTA